MPEPMPGDIHELTMQTTVAVTIQWLRDRHQVPVAVPPAVINRGDSPFGGEERTSGGVLFRSRHRPNESPILVVVGDTLGFDGDTRVEIIDPRT